MKWYEKDYGESPEDNIYKKAYLRKKGVKWKPQKIRAKDFKKTGKKKKKKKSLLKKIFG